MPWGTNQSPTMQNAISNVGAPGPYQSAFSMFPVQYRASDQGYLMGRANQQNNKPLDRAGGEGYVSHSAMLTHAERAARIKELLELDSGSFQAMSGKLVMPSPEEYKKKYYTMLVITDVIFFRVL